MIPIDEQTHTVAGRVVANAQGLALEVIPPNKAARDAQQLIELLDRVHVRGSLHEAARLAALATIRAAEAERPSLRGRWLHVLDGLVDLIKYYATEV